MVTRPLWPNVESIVADAATVTASVAFVVHWPSAECASSSKDDTPSGCESEGKSVTVKSSFALEMLEPEKRSDGISVLGVLTATAWPCAVVPRSRWMAMLAASPACSVTLAVVNVSAHGAPLSPLGDASAVGVGAASTPQRKPPCCHRSYTRPRRMAGL
jgi:hypothetical protein